MQQIPIVNEYITLGQLLKKLEIVDTGGQVKGFLAERRVRVNGQEEQRRGRKVYPQDIVEIEGFEPIRLIRA